MREEEALHAGVALIQVVRDVERPSYKETGPSKQALRFVQVAISKLRERISRQEYINDDGSIMAVAWLCHLSVCKAYSVVIFMGSQRIEAIRRYASISNAPQRPRYDDSITRRAGRSGL